MPYESALIDRVAASRGGAYREVVDRGWAQDLIDRNIQQQWVADQLGVTQGTVSKIVAALKEDLAREQAELEFQERMDGEPYPRFIPIHEFDDDQLHELVDYFARWRGEYFKTPALGSYVTPTHQRRWAFLILQAIRDGRCLLVLSPPRHGKTELLIHLDAFLITRVNPNIRIVKVCKSEGLAKKAVGSVLDQLSSNDDLLEATLPDGGTYQPQHGSRRSWTSSEFTTAQRTVAGLKSPTMAAVGAKGTLLSRDGDVFSIDDIEDYRTTATPEMRQQTREWFASDLMSRKEASTSMVAIGSRQHPDDIWGHLIDNPNWDVVVEQAHNDAECEVEDPDNPDNYHLHVDCMLWPEVRDYEWLMGVKYDPERASTYAMTYQNEPQDTAVDVFTREIFDLCRDLDRVTGSIPTNYVDNDGHTHRHRLIAGLDPASTGYQAAFLWAFDPAGDQLYAVDFNNRLGGGVGRARQQIQEWFERYGVATWVIEENLYRRGIISDELLMAYCNLNSITLIGHETYGNKWDDQLGVTAMATPMSRGRVSIPWGDQATQSHWSAYRKQLINFSRDRIKSRKGTTDIVMASWFPWETIRSWRRAYMEDFFSANHPDEDESLFVASSDIYSELFPSIYSSVMG